METTKKFNAKSVKQFLGNNAIIILLVAIAIGVGFARPAFFKPANMVNLMKNASIRYIIALGISGCLITTGNDLSAGRTVGFAACIAAIFLQRADYPDRFYPGMPELPLFAVLLIVMAICAVIGMCNGLVVSYLKVQPFIATLGMQTIVYGICLVYTGARPIGGLREDFTNLANKGVFGTGFSYVFVFAIVIFAFMWFLYNKTRHGKYMYAIGGNENAAEVAGVNVPRTKIKIYMLASMLFAVAGFLMAAKSG
ncbi:MAG: beta-methylgalactoside transporter, partial [Pygmaiobacter sp.]